MTPKNLPRRPTGRAPYAVKLMEPQAQDRVLDVGCYDGALEGHYLYGRVHSFFGVDVNKDAISRANAWAKNTRGCEESFQIAEAEHLPFPDAHFDKILCLDAFEHVADEQKTAQEFYRVLKPGGHLILSVPHDFLNFLDHDEITRGMRNFVRKYIRKKPLLDHPKHRHYSESALRSFFSPFEFEVIHRSGTPVFWIITFINSCLGLPERWVEKMSRWTGALEDWDYQKRLKTGFNIMVKLKKPLN